MYPLVTIVTPTFNQANFLKRTIESVLAQDYPNIEYWVFDDGSSDATPEVLAPYSGRLLLRRHNNKGQANTLNIGWNEARGSILGYLSSDDLLYPGAVRAAVACLVKHPEVAVAYPDFHIIDPADQVLKTYRAGAFDYSRMVSTMDCRIGPGAFFRKSEFLRAGGWNPDFRLIPDLEFWFRMGLFGTFMNIPQVHAAFRMHPGSTTFSNTRIEVAEEYSRMVELFVARGDLPAEIINLKKLMVSNAFISDARTHLRAGRLILAFQKLRRAWDAGGGRVDWGPVTAMLAKALIGRSAHQLRWGIRRLVRGG